MEKRLASEAFTDAFIENLIADMARLGSRPYAEIGVPMFLVAEDLTSASVCVANQSTNGHDLATLFAQMVDALNHRKPELDADDIARLIEVLADRYFLAFAMPAFSCIPELHSGKK
jgi:hypothetical protein